MPKTGPGWEKTVQVFLPGDENPTTMEAEVHPMDTVEKVYGFFQIDRALYDICSQGINISQEAWAAECVWTTYTFVRRSWKDRSKALFTFKNYEIGLSEPLIREMMFFI